MVSVQSIIAACRSGDLKQLALALKGINGVKDGHIADYAAYLKDAKYMTIQEVEKIIEEVNRNVEEEEKKGLS